ncbi:hypothetical protein [Amycolatopsis thermophila]|uniref:Uncharacterized protein n=1 Tax=Amycolatopsis thermophila TaxID=206084 RepID=A0ABU0F3F0_9PSEU|nr:hypothetical protein [Amycolatopsis thermophila]MDQ0382018.1 hypothetical protein [Amycolatopsis thermophila]
MRLGRREIAGLVVVAAAAATVIAGGVHLAGTGRDAPASSPQGTRLTHPILRAPDSEYPRFAMKSTLDPRTAARLSGDPVIMLAPGVYAEAEAGRPIGTPSDYRDYVGECAAVSRYAQEHPGRTVACW